MANFNLGTLNYTIGADLSQLERDLDRASKKMQGIGRSMSRVGRTLTRNVTLPVVAMGGAALKTAGDFEEAMNKVAALAGIAADDSSEAFQAISEEARRLGKETEFSANEAAQAFGIFAQKGFEVQQMLGAVAPTLDLASAAGTDLASAAELASDVMNSFGKTADDIPDIADKITQAFTSSGASFDSIKKSLEFVAPTAQQVGVSMEEALSALSALGDVGIRSSKAGTALNAMLTQMVKKSDKLGVAVLNAQGEMRPLVDIFADIEAKGLSFAQVLDILGIRGNRAFATLEKDGARAFKAFESQMASADGQASKVATTMRQGLNFELKQLASSLQDLAISIADSGLRDFAAGLVKDVRLLANRIGKLNPAILKTAAVVAGAAAAIGPLLVGMGGLIRLGGVAATAISTLSALLPSAGAAFAALTGPVGIAAAAIAGAAVLIYTRWEEITEFFTRGDGRQAFDTLRKVVTTAVDDIVEVWDILAAQFRKTWDSIRQDVRDFQDAFGDEIITCVKRFARFISESFANMALAVKESVSLVVDVITGDWEGALESLINLAKAVFNQFINIVQNTGGVFINTLSAMASALGMDGLEGALDVAMAKMDQFAKKAKFAFKPAPPRVPLAEVDAMESWIQEQSSVSFSAELDLDTSSSSSRTVSGSSQVAGVSPQRSISPIAPEQGTRMNATVASVQVKGLDAATKKLFDFAQKFDMSIQKAREFRQRMADIANTINSAIGPAIAGAFQAMGDAFGRAVAQGKSFGKVMGAMAKGVGVSVLNTLAELAIRVGKIAIATGIAIEGIKKALQSLNPIAAIAAGAALIAVGAAVKGALSGAARGAGGGMGRGGYDLSNNGGMNMASLDSGGVTTADGVAMLHKNEVVRDKKMDDRMFSQSRGSANITVQDIILEGDKIRYVLDAVNRRRAADGLSV